MVTNDSVPRPRYYYTFMQDIYVLMEAHNDDQPDDFPAMMAYNTAADLVDGMFKGVANTEQIRATYDKFIDVMNSNAAYEAQDESMASAAEAYREIAQEAALAKEGK